MADDGCRRWRGGNSAAALRQRGFRIHTPPPARPFTRRTSGRRCIVLADGATGASVHVQFIPDTPVPYEPPRGAAPNGLYALHPAGIEVSGHVGLRIAPTQRHARLHS